MVTISPAVCLWPGLYVLLFTYIMCYYYPSSLGLHKLGQNDTLHFIFSISLESCNSPRHFAIQDILQCIEENEEKDEESCCKKTFVQSSLNRTHVYNWNSHLNPLLKQKNCVLFCCYLCYANVVFLQAPLGKEISFKDPLACSIPTRHLCKIAG